jgi:hypothetical protein
LFHLGADLLFRILGVMPDADILDRNKKLAWAIKK